jgi:hypothetical protein
MWWQKLVRMSCHRTATVAGRETESTANEFARDPTVGNLLGILPWGKVLKAGKGAEFLRKVLRARKLPEKYVRIITDASLGWKKGKKDFGIGSATREEADELGQIFVGPGYVDKGDRFVSADGLRVYRKPSYKPGRNQTQANFITQQRRYDKKGKELSKKEVVGNGHLDILP